VFTQHSLEQARITAFKCVRHRFVFSLPPRGHLAPKANLHKVHEDLQVKLQLAVEPIQERVVRGTHDRGMKCHVCPNKPRGRRSIFEWAQGGRAHLPQEFSQTPYVVAICMDNGFIGRKVFEHPPQRENAIRVLRVNPAEGGPAPARYGQETLGL
jgi:hypothetical protein